MNKFPFTPVEFLCFFVVMWLSVTGLLSLIGGWFWLWLRYPRKEKTEGRLFRMASVSLGPNCFPFTIFPVNYDRCLFVRVGKSGFDMSMLLPFRFLHFPLFIPWSEVESCGELRILWMRFTALVTKSPRRRLVFKGKLGVAVREAYENWKSPPPDTGPFATSDSSWNESLNRPPDDERGEQVYDDCQRPDFRGSSSSIQCMSRVARRRSIAHFQALFTGTAWSRRHRTLSLRSATKMRPASSSSRGLKT